MLEDQLAVSGAIQRAMRGQVCAQDVGQHQRITRIAFGSTDDVAIAIPRHGQRVDREQLITRCQQRRREQSLRCLHRDRNRGFAALGLLGQQFQQLAKADRAVVDPALEHQDSVIVDHCNVVMALGPIDAAPHPHPMPPLVRPKLGAPRYGSSRKRVRVALMRGLSGPPSHQSFAAPSDRQHPPSGEGLTGPALASRDAVSGSRLR